MEAIKFKKNHWIDVKNPTKEVLLPLAKKYRFHELDLEDCLQESQRPKIDEYEKYLFIVLQFPVYSKSQHHFNTGQLGIFIGPNHLITVHEDKLPPLEDMFEQCKKSIKQRRILFGENTGYLLYEIISAIFTSIFPITDKIEVSIKKIEGGIFEFTHPKDQLFDIMVLKKNVITLRKIILPQRSVIAALEHKQKSFMPENLTVYFDDVVDQIEKIWNILETQKEVIESLEDTNESILSHNINLTMRTLTVFSAIMLPLTFLTGLFGMNVKLPFIQTLENVENFWHITIMMLILIVVMFGFFKWKKWL